MTARWTEIDERPSFCYIGFLVFADFASADEEIVGHEVFLSIPCGDHGTVGNVVDPTFIYFGSIQT